MKFVIWELPRPTGSFSLSGHLELRQSIASLTINLQPWVQPDTILIA